jgi:hypothetical protein
MSSLYNACTAYREINILISFHKTATPHEVLLVQYIKINITMDFSHFELIFFLLVVSCLYTLRNTMNQMVLEIIWLLERTTLVRENFIKRQHSTRNSCARTFLAPIAFHWILVDSTEISISQIFCCCFKPLLAISTWMEPSGSQKLGRALETSLVQLNRICSMITNTEFRH